MSKNSFIFLFLGNMIKLVLQNLACTIILRHYIIDSLYTHTQKEILLKVNKSQNIFFLKVHWPNNEWNIRQNSALEFKKWLNQAIKGLFPC